MTTSRTAALSLAALLAVGGTTALTTGLAAAQTAPSTPTTVGDPSATTVPSTPTDVAITLPGLGDIALSVDPGTGQIVSLTVTPIDGVTASDPVAVHGGVQIDFTLADGTVRAMIVEVHVRDGAVRVEVDPADDEEDDGAHVGPPPVDERGDSADHRNDDNGRNQGEHRGTSTTIANATPPPSTTPRTSRPEPTDERPSSTRPTTQSGTGSRTEERD